MPVTMSDVARAAGVSVMTVSNVLAGRKRVGEETRRRVLAAVDDLGYELNLTARHLRAGRTDTVALVVPRFDHPYFGELAARLARRLDRSGRHLVVEQSGASREGELEALTLARLHLYDGVLLSVVGMTPDDVARLRTTVPVVLLGEQDMPDRFDQVRMDNVEGARLATAHLLATGARRIAAVGGSTSGRGMTMVRTLGWRRAHEESGLPIDDALVVPCDVDLAGGRRAIRQLVAEGTPFDAVFAFTDTLATGVLAGLAEAGLRVPDDVQVVGFDNLDSSEFLVPGLTTVDPGHEAMADHALRLLDRLIDRAPDGDRGTAVVPEHVTGPVSLVVRGTTRPAA
ncbi:LacI family DNA-binding transcriptional regulator [Isoptericola variabilis]|uniref:Transcriptional regulator, LacI family n=1 Tax=Isoptericola variabilis (strain 225) TaxID=743718 RepID=F6FR71_ISOV2|nr:LacI family DNA-binding transcriptional regulator [Isoptericola variabilis]AEG42931.1 transcriptional regulator, LacI family [Isoptericola variabilis 225]TWH31819.1 LacI family transcriptional regulator [Isoptericola variabilis J7]